MRRGPSARTLTSMASSSMASADSPVPSRTRLHLSPVRPRDPGERHRAASTLELFFDLVFVIAVSLASTNLHESLVEGHVRHGISSYLMIFFAVWWAWMNFTWFATSFDNDDWLYRVMTFVQMAGVLVLAAGIPPAFSDGDFRLVVVGYAVMRLAMVSQWLRASRAGGAAGRAARVYAGGIAAVQVLWVAWLFLPGQAQAVVFLVLVAAELTVPVVAERRGRTPWHARHITERYGLFTLILMGESLLGSANAIIEALHEGEYLGELVPLAVLAFTVTACLWWIYFWAPHHGRISDMAHSLVYGYGHYFIFAAAGALSAGIESEISSITGHSELGEIATSFTVTLPVAVFMAGVWLLVIRPVGSRLVNLVVPLAALLVFLDPLIPVPTAWSAVVLVLVVAVLVAGPDGADQQE